MTLKSFRQDFTIRTSQTKKIYLELCFSSLSVCLFIYLSFKLFLYSLKYWFYEFGNVNLSVIILYIKKDIACEDNNPTVAEAATIVRL